MLGRRLNGMAGDLDQALLLRRQVAVLEERQRLARDLHDTVKQQAFAEALLIGSAQLHLDAGDISGAHAALTEAGTVAQQIQTDLANVLANRTESTGDLPGALKGIAADWTRRSGVSVALENRITDPGTPIDTVSATQAARITEEAIANAVKHSKSAQINVLLEREGRQIQLSVTDKGVGFDPAAPRGQGMGLSTMRERVALLPQGELEILSAPGVGTNVILRFSE
jgi:signal transduction histidine kinase